MYCEIIDSSVNTKYIEQARIKPQIIQEKDRTDRVKTIDNLGERQNRKG